MPPNDSGQKPLLEWVLERFPETPKTRAKQWIVSGRVLLDGAVARKPHQLITNPGSALELATRTTASLIAGKHWQIHPRVSLVYLDLSVAVVNKGPGLLSVPGPGSELSALSIVADFLAGKIRARHAGPQTLPAAYRKLQPLPVHRLDQYTSGLFCMAMNVSAREKLIEAVKSHHMTREYIAFVQGRPGARKGTWRHALRLSTDTFHQQVVESHSPDAREAITHYEVLAEFPIARDEIISKLRLRLETGLKHQIRIQAAEEGLPLVGDRTYNRRLRGHTAPALPLVVSRHALHSETLALEHPGQPGKQLSWSAPLAPDLQRLEQALRAKPAAARTPPSQQLPEEIPGS